MPRVSVIIPTYNRANYICEAIDSVLSQTYTDYEIMVIDDGSTDNTKGVLQPYSSKIKYLFQENRGIAAARNYGIRNSTGEFIAMLDSDDQWLPEKLKIQVATISSNPELAFVCSGSYVIDGDGKIIDIWKKSRKLNSETFDNLYKKDFVLTLTVLLRRTHFEAIDGFDDEYKVSQDYELWLRLAKRYKFYYINLPLAKYRIHGWNITLTNIDEKLVDHIRLARKKSISRGLSFMKMQTKVAREYYDFGLLNYSMHRYFKAGICYFNSTLNFPLVGCYYWPEETNKLRFSLPYRILHVYIMIIKCLLKNMSNRCL